jgi:hypothetical protein
VSAAAAKQTAVKFDDLAKRIDAMGTTFGAGSTAAEALKKLTGNQNALTDLRNEYDRLKNAGVIANLPPGAASDKDIAFAAQGIPPSNASPESMAQYVRGVAKASAIAAALDNAKVDWMAQNKGLMTRAKDTFIAGDFSVKAGETFGDFSGRVAESVTKQRAPKPATPSAAPAAPSSVRAEADAVLAGKKPAASGAR